MKYTYEDIITAKDIITGKVKKEDIIGKKGWGLDTLTRLSEVLMRKPDKLNLIAESTSYPFFAGLYRNIYFLPEKVEKPKYVPFDLSLEEDRVRLRGAWVREKGSEKELAVTAIFLNERPPFVKLNDNGFTAEWFFKYFEFLDGTPCGKLEVVE